MGGFVDWHSSYESAHINRWQSQKGHGMSCRRNTKNRLVLGYWGVTAILLFGNAGVDPQLHVLSPLSWTNIDTRLSPLALRFPHPIHFWRLLIPHRTQIPSPSMDVFSNLICQLFHDPIPSAAPATHQPCITLSMAPSDAGQAAFALSVPTILLGLP